MSTPGSRLIFLSPHDPNNVGTWSGTAYSAYVSLRQSCPRIEVVRAKFTDGLARVVTRLLRKLGVKLDCTRSIVYARLASMEASIRLHFTPGDVIIAVAAATYVFALRTSRPIIFVSDATFASISSIYADFAIMPQWLRKDADKIERVSLRRSQRVLLSSDWAKASAIVDYGVAPEAISVMPLGPNLTRATIDLFKSSKSSDFTGAVRLLFIGADWDRKGGPIVLNIKKELEACGIHCEVFLVGNCPKELHSGTGIHVFGRLDKSDATQLQELCRLFELAHFFVLPTTAEAFGIVFSEAQAFGCPSITYAVGGTPTAVLDGITGFTLPLEAVARDFAEKICSLVRDPRQYERMSASCRTRYLNEANWTTWAAFVMSLAEQLRNPSGAVLTPRNLPH